MNILHGHVKSATITAKFTLPHLYVHRQIRSRIQYPTDNHSSTSCSVTPIKDLSTGPTMTNPPSLSSKSSSSSSSSSVFDRLYSKSTESARIRKTTPKEPTVPKNILEREDEENQKNSHNIMVKKSSGRKSVPIKRGVSHKKKLMNTTNGTNSSVYDRLYSKSTASSKSKRSGTTTTTTAAATTTNGNENSKNPLEH